MRIAKGKDIIIMWVIINMLAAYSNNVVYQWRFEEPIQLDVIVLNDILQYHNK